jgi:hypothetical protein
MMANSFYTNTITGSHVHWNHTCPTLPTYVSPCLFTVLFVQLILLAVSLKILKKLRP